MSYWQDKVVLVTGGSRGFGRVLAGAFAQSGARVIITARDADRLGVAADEIRRQGGNVFAVPADLTRDDDVDRLVAAGLEQFGPLDCLVNNAGRSMRRRVLETTPDEFAELMDLNLTAVVRLTRAVVPHLLPRRGHVVNIGSLGSKATARFLGAYPATKFALAAYSQQLRLELGPEGLHVLLVCPGPIARDEPSSIPAADLDALPPQARQPGGGVKTRPLDPHRLARDILNACQHRRPELVRPRLARILFALAQLSPRLGDWLIRRAGG